MTQDEAQTLAQNPVEWEGGPPRHNWRDYVGENVRRLWDTLSLEHKTAIILDAFVFVSREDWE